MKKIKVRIPYNIVVKNPTNKFHNIKKLLPVIIRPSYVLGGENMKIIKNYTHLNKILHQYTTKQYKHMLPLIIDKFINKAYEYDVDCIVTQREIKILPILKQIERLGIHSGDSSAYLLKQNKLYNKIQTVCKKIITILKITGFCNIQLGVKHNIITVIEVNARASRTIPFINKATNINYIKLGIKGLLKNKKIRVPYINNKLQALKTAIFSTYKFKNIYTLLGPEMKSTGEAITFEKTITRAFIKSQQNLLKNARKILLLITLLTNEIREIIQEIHKNSTKVKIYCNKNIKLPTIKHLITAIPTNYDKIDYCLIFETSNTHFENEKTILHTKQIQFYSDLNVIKRLTRGLNKTTYTPIKYNDIFKKNKSNIIF
ncbi:ATP-binding protein [Candidatus Vidania fulgoroideorum]